jgi:glycosyltransferase involved in cell wall biosynthesis
VGSQIRIGRFLKEFKPDLIHTQDVTGCSVAALKWGRRHRVPVVGTRHFTIGLAMAYISVPVLPVRDAVRTFLDTYIKDYYKLCTVITCPTETVRQSLRAEGVRRQIEVVSNGVDIPPLVTKKPTPNGRPLVLCVSRIDEDKNIPLLLKSAPLIQQESDAEIIIIGSGNRLKTYKQYAKRHGLSNVRFLGSLPANSPALEEWYAKATVFVIPSLIETQSIVTLEAMAHALPVVAVRAGALPELVHHEKTGYLVPVAVPIHFAQGVLTLLKDPALAVRYGKAARVFVEQEHARARTFQDLMTVYNKAVAGGYGRKVHK